MFNRLFFLIALFFSQSALSETMGGSNTYTYWSSYGNSQCNTNLSTLCTSAYGNAIPSDSSCTTTSVECKDNTNGTLKIITSCPAYGNPSGPREASYEFRNNVSFFSKNSITCIAGKHLELSGCNATCEPDVDCSSKAGTTQNLSVQCGTVFCSAGVTVAQNGGYSCTQGGVASFSRSSLSNNAIKGQCVLSPPGNTSTITGEQTLAKSSQLGGNSIPVYCNLDYQYTGAMSDGASDTPSDVGDLPFQVSYVPRNPDGHCNPGFVPGERNGELICAPDPTSTSGGCPTGQIRNNSGICESTSTAGQPKTTTTNPDGSVTEEETKTNPDGSTTKTTTNTKNNPDGTTTTTKTTETTNQAGNKTTSTESTTAPNGLPCPTGQSRNSAHLCSTTATCDPSTSICEGSGDGNNTGSGGGGSLTKPTKIENTVTDSWWKKTYTDGIQGVWQSHQSDLNNTAFVTSLNQFKSGIPNTGSCPVFALNLGQYNGTISPPCIIWPFLRAVFLFSTMMLCRRIVFGG